MVPKSLRRRVMEVAHVSMLEGHLDTKKTEDRIQTNFYWPGMHQDVTSFCRSCDVCQKTVTKRSIPHAPLGEMSLIDLPFKRVAIDLVKTIRAITPASEKGHRCIMTLVDYATRKSEAVPIKNIDTETVAEALLDMHSRVAVPVKVLSDFVTQFVSEYMGEFSRLLSSKHFTTTPYHPVCKGLVKTERFNGTLKKMLQRLCSEQPKQWFINPLLLANREASQEATGFVPF